MAQYESLGVKDLKDIKIEELGRDEMKTIYQLDYVNDLETLRKVYDPDSSDEMEDPFPALVRSGKPVEPLISALRVCPGIPRYYNTSKSEYQITIGKVGKMVTKDFKETLESNTEAEPKLIEQCK